jgi:hypothetical protein
MDYHSRFLTLSRLLVLDSFKKYVDIEKGYATRDEKIYTIDNIMYDKYIVKNLKDPIQDVKNKIFPSGCKNIRHTDEKNGIYSILVPHSSYLKTGTINNYKKSKKNSLIFAMMKYIILILILSYTIFVIYDLREEFRRNPVKITHSFKTLFGISINSTNGDGDGDGDNQSSKISPLPREHMEEEE